jgi:hypothetical protein
MPALRAVGNNCGSEHCSALDNSYSRFCSGLLVPSCIHALQAAPHTLSTDLFAKRLICHKKRYKRAFILGSYYFRCKAIDFSSNAYGIVREVCAARQYL